MPEHVLAPRRTIEMRVLRYRPEQDDKPVWQSYTVPFTDDMSVLQGLQYIKDHFDGSLTFRWSCRMAICGSCGGQAVVPFAPRNDRPVYCSSCFDKVRAGTLTATVTV